MTQTTILLLTHHAIGQALLDTAKNTFGELPENLIYLGVCPKQDRDVIIEEARNIAKNSGHGGLLILTDMYGSTPCNIAQILLKEGHHVTQLVAGLNLPMLFRVLNYANLSLSILTSKALTGGKEGVIVSGP